MYDRDVISAYLGPRLKLIDWIWFWHWDAKVGSMRQELGVWTVRASNARPRQRIVEFGLGLLGFGEELVGILVMRWSNEGSILKGRPSSIHLEWKQVRRGLHPTPSNVSPAEARNVASEQSFNILPPPIYTFHNPKVEVMKRGVSSGTCKG